MPVITIARQFGAGGSTVAQTVARQLQADVLDRQLIVRVARRLEVPPAEVEAEDEQPTSYLTRLLTALGSAGVPGIQGGAAAWIPPYEDPSNDLRVGVLELTRQVIKEAARGGNVIIIGRGAAHILRDVEQALHVFLRAAEPIRAQNLMARLAIDRAEAKRRLQQTDRDRAAYIRQVYGYSWTHPSNYHMVLDTGRLGHELTASVIIAAASGRHHQMTG
jgi:cytidylate kinase